MFSFATDVIQMTVSIAQMFWQEFPAQAELVDLEFKGHRNQSEHRTQPCCDRPRNAPRASHIKHSHLMIELELSFSKGTQILINVLN